MVWLRVPGSMVKPGMLATSVQMMVPVIPDRMICPSLLVVYSPLEDSLPPSASTTLPSA